MADPMWWQKFQNFSYLHETRYNGVYGNKLNNTICVAWLQDELKWLNYWPQKPPVNFVRYIKSAIFNFVFLASDLKSVISKNICTEFHTNLTKSCILPIFGCLLAHFAEDEIYSEFVIFWFVLSDKGESFWDHVVHSNPKLAKEINSGDVAADPYNKFETDVNLVKELGVGIFKWLIHYSYN